jgi:uncharacterized protein (TIGR03118 family)
MTNRSVTFHLGSRFRAVASVATVARVATVIGGVAAMCLPAPCQDDSAITGTNSYVQTNLVSDVPALALHTDSHLSNPWGVSHGLVTPWWVSDANTGVSTLYLGKGTALPIVVTIPPANGTGMGSPTGTVYTGGKFIFVTLDGTISDWVSGSSAIIRVNHAGNAAYTGITMATLNGQTVLYVANAMAGIEVYDLSYNPVALPAGAFQDTTLPAGYTPYNVQHAGLKVWVTYAQGRNTGAGLGFVDGFNSDGKLLQRLESGTWMNAPWGVAMAPASFGAFGRDLLIGNLGSGQIAAFSPTTGNFIDVLRDSTGNPISNYGLWALSFGNGILTGPADALYFTAGIDGQTHGLFGTITPAP